MCHDLPKSQFSGGRGCILKPSNLDSLTIFIFRWGYSEFESVSDNESNEEGTCESESEEDECLDQCLVKYHDNVEKMNALERESKKRIESLQKILAQQKESKQSKRTTKMVASAHHSRDKKREIARLDDELNKRADQLERLQKYEEELSSLIEVEPSTSKHRTSAKSMAPSAASTPAEGTYANVLHDLLEKSIPVKRGRMNKHDDMDRIMSGLLQSDESRGSKPSVKHVNVVGKRGKLT